MALVNAVVPRRPRRRRVALAVAAALLWIVPLLGAGYEHLSAAAGRASHPVPGRMVDVGGRLLHVVQHGTGGPTVVLEAGSGEAASGWEAVTDRLAPTTTVVAYDRAGIARSEPSPRPRTARAVVDDLRTALHAIDAPQPYVLVGHSLGGLYVREYVREHPGEVAGLVLVDARPEDDARRTAPLLPDGAGAGTIPPWIGRSLHAVGALRIGGGALLDGMVPPAGRREFLDVTASPTYFATKQAEADHIAPTERALRGQDLGALPVRVIARAVPQDYASAGIDAATGRRLEDIWQDGQRRMLHLSSDSTLVVAGGSGHMVPTERPDLVADVVRSLVKELRDGT